MTTAADASHVADALASIYDAAAVRVPPWLAVVSAIASIRPGSIGELIDWLAAHRGELEASFAAGSTARIAAAVLPPELQYEDELGYLDRPRDDHALRGRYLFADLVGRWSFMQTTVYAITGLELARRDADLLEEIGTINLPVDRRAWPMAVTRRVAARGGSYAEAVAAGQAMLGGTMLAGAAAADCARFLQAARAVEREGGSAAQLVAETLARRERVMGFGRPVVGPDERVPIMQAVLERHGRHDLPYVALLRVVDEAFHAGRGLRSTAAAWAAAILCDFGMTPMQVEAVSNAWVSVCIYAQAAFSHQRGAGAAPPGPHAPPR